MKRRFLLCLAALAPLAAAPLIITSDDPPTTTPIVSWFGPRSAIDQTEFHLITTRDLWRDLWTRHLAGKGEHRVAHGSGLIFPEVDFSRYMIVAAFRGASTNSDGLVVKSVHQTDEHLIVRFESYSFQTAGPDGGAASVTPYGIWLLPRVEKPIILEENIQNLKAGEPIWRQRHRLDAPKKVW